MLCIAGAELVTDDVLTVDPGPPVMCTGGASELRLRQAAASIGQGRHGTSTRMTARRAPRPRRQDGAATAITDRRNRHSIAVAHRRSRVEFKRLEPSTALFALLSFPRVHGWQRSDVLTRDFSTLTDVVNRVPIYDATIPWGPPFDPDVADALLTLATESPSTDAGRATARCGS